MKLALKTSPICKAAFWLVFGVMLIAMFGFRGVRSQQVATSCAAVLAVAVAACLARSARRAS